MRDFKVPDLPTPSRGEVELEYAFELRAHYDPPRLSATPKGGFRYQDITGGEVRGARFNATVYPDSGGQYDTVRSDGVRDVDAHFILKAENGEWVYVEHVGYRRPDGYYRAIAYIDAGAKGAYDWLNNTTFVVTARESPDQREVVFRYFVAN
ncbi:MAG: DUF3237 domain-containing protein [Steroidobacteraceae bacterium]